MVPRAQLAPASLGRHLSVVAMAPECGEPCRLSGRAEPRQDLKADVSAPQARPQLPWPAAWMLTSDRRHEKETTSLITELKADWCRVQKLLGRSRDKAGNLMPGLHFGYFDHCAAAADLRHHPPTEQVDLALPAPSCESVAAPSGPLKVTSPAFRRLRSTPDPPPQPRQRRQRPLLRRGRLLTLRPSSLRARSRQSRRAATPRRRRG